MGNVLISRRAFLGGTGGGGGGTLPSDYESLEYVKCGSGTNKYSGFVLYNYIPRYEDYVNTITTKPSGNGESAFLGGQNIEGYYKAGEIKGWDSDSFALISYTDISGQPNDSIFKFKRSSGYYNDPTGTLIKIGYYTTDYKYNGKIYYIKFYNNSKTLIELIPCKRKSDNVVGMFDLVHQEFYSSTVGDPFTAPSNP